jgi:hypothetical protein
MQALRLAGDICAATADGVVEEGLAIYRSAIVLGERLGMLPDVAHCHLGIGRLHLKKGAIEEARSEFAVAVSMYEQLSMVGYVERARDAVQQLLSTPGSNHCAHAGLTSAIEIRGG